VDNRLTLYKYARIVISSTRMNQKNLVFLLIVALISISAYSQKSSNFIVGFEVGSNFVFGELNPAWNVRQDVGSYDYEYGSMYSGTATEMTMSYIGIKPELSFFKNKLGISSGLRYTRMNNALSNKSSFFYLRDNVSSSNTDYFKVKKINEDNDYLGIPLEVTYVPFQNDYLDIYFRAGAELNFRFNTQLDIRFLNSDMNPYQQEIIRHTGITTNTVYSSFYTGVGIRFGNRNDVKYNLELILPSYILSDNNSSVIIPKYYTGFKFSVQIPVHKTGMVKTEKL